MRCRTANTTDHYAIEVMLIPNISFQFASIRYVRSIDKLRT